MKKAFTLNFILLLSTLSIYAANEPLLIQKNKEENVVNSAVYYIDNTSHLSIDDIIKLNPSEFLKPKSSVLTAPPSSASFWVKFSMINQSHRKIYLKIDNPTADTVNIYYYDASKSRYVSQQFGYNVPLGNRAVKCPSIIFELPYDNQKADYYIKINSRKLIYLPIYAGNLDPIMDEVFQNFLLDALYVGLIIGMVLFNLFLAFSLKSRTYFLYVFFIIFLSGFTIHWKGYPIFLNDSIKLFWGNFSNSMGALSVICSIWFAVYFLEIKQYSIKLYYYCYFLTVINLPVIICEILGYKSLGINLQVPATNLTSLSLVIISAYIFYKGLKHARFHLLANGLYQLSLTMFIFIRYDIVPMARFHNHVLPFGHALETTILAIALVDRINQIRKEKEKTLEASLEQEKELNEELQTREEDLAASENGLKNANHKLQILNQDLIDKNGQLIDNQIQLFTSLEEARILNNKLSLREEELTSKEEELRQSLDELNLTYKQLKESERMLMLSQKIAKSGSWKLNLKGGNFEFSEPLYDLFEIPYGTKMTRDLLKKIMGEQVFNEISQAAYKAIEKKTSFNSSYQIVLKNGQVRYLYSTATPYLDENGDVKEVYGNTQDVTEMRKAEELLNKQTTELIESNKKAAEYKLLALRSVMNPHFLFNSLNSIQYFITKNDREQALTYLAMFSKLIRSILNSSIANYNAILDEIEILKLYVNLESLRFANKFKSEFIVDEVLSQEEILIPSLLLQPYIENAIIHGLFHKQGSDGLLKITFQKKNAKVLCIVEDNGIGRAYAQEIKNKNNLHKSIGMLVTKERIDLINNDDNVSVIITDLFNDQNLPSGTKVEVLVAYK